jgi:hypothetical protein
MPALLAASVIERPFELAVDARGLEQIRVMLKRAYLVSTE